MHVSLTIVVYFFRALRSHRLILSWQVPSSCPSEVFASQLPIISSSAAPPPPRTTAPEYLVPAPTPGEASVAAVARMSSRAGSPNVPPSAVTGACVVLSPILDSVPVDDGRLVLSLMTCVVETSNFSSRAFLFQKWKLTLDYFLGYRISLHWDIFQFILIWRRFSSLHSGVEAAWICQQ